MASGGGSTRGNLTEEQHNKIQNNFTFLIREIKHDPMCVADSLFEKDAFNEDDKEKIEKAEKDSRKAAAKKILDIIFGCGHTGYDKFIAALYDNQYYNAVFKLEPGYKGHRDNEPGITTYDELLAGLQELKSGLDEFRKGNIDLLGKRSIDSHRLRTMKGEALENLNYVKDKKYVETRALYEGLKILKNHQILGIVGAAGDGKTVLSMMIAKQFIEERPEYKPLLINDLDDLKEVSFEDDKYLYIIDDMYGKYNKLQARIDKWPAHFGTLRVNKERGKLVIIYVMRDYIYLSSKYQFDKYDLFVEHVEKTNKIFLHKGEFSLNTKEKGQFLDFYEISSNKIISKITDCFGFPSIASLCSKLTTDKLPAIFDSSHEFLILELETFWNENKYIYARLALVFCLHTVSEKDLKQNCPARVKSLISTVTKEICPEFKLNGAKRNLNELSDTFLKHYMNIFSLRDFVGVPFLHHLSVECMEMALQYCSFELLMSVVRTNHQVDRCIKIHDDYFDELSMRFLKELHDKHADIVSHPAFIDYKFLLHFLGRNDIANLLHTKFINLGDIREVQESGNFLHYITLHGDMRCLEAALFYFHDQLPQLVEEKTDMG
ncbi:uncharacterized protein LOC130014242 isoform X2 [Patella vulgata]|uniref:uncharacterized protein LOC130014242 isoform X2 n=1 Tax=Patella vulgata TaxID=6465 RepID=UPI0024A8C4A4|nr:uncharacterized protein LOC130014242 isoform X2 [Patella vulgata]